MEESKPSVEELLSILIMQQMRNYDALMHLLLHFDEEVAVKLLEVHKSLETVGPPPFFFNEDKVEE